MLRLCIKKQVSIGGKKAKKKAGAKLLVRLLTLSSSRFFGSLFVPWGVAPAVGELSETNTDNNLAERAEDTATHQSSTLCSWLGIVQEFREFMPPILRMHGKKFTTLVPVS